MPSLSGSRLAPIAAAVAACLLAAPAPAQQIQAAAPLLYDLPAAALADTLSQISLRSGRTIAAPAGLVQGREAAPVRGRYSAEDAARQALSGSGLELVITPAGTLTLRPAPVSGNAAVTSLQAMTVTGSNAVGPSEGTGSYGATESNSATRLDLSIRRTPQSVSVITRQQMDEQGIVNVADALRQTPGVSVNRDNSEGYSFYVRGFQLQNFQYDGLPSLSSDGGNVRDNYSIGNSVIYDRIEILKGATGLLNGAGYPSGVVNFVRKRPTAALQASAAVGAGSWDRHRGELDISAPLAANGKLRGRAVAASEEHDSFIDHARGKQRIFYGIVEADVSPRSTVALGIEHQQDDSDGSTNSHLPAFYSDGSVARLPRSTNPADKWTWRDQRTQRVFADATHRYDNGWQLKLAAAHREYRSRELIGGMSSALIDVDDHGIDHGFYPGGASRFDTDTRENSIDLQLSGPYTLAGREHELVLGYNASRTKAQSRRADGDTDARIDDVFDWDNDAAEPTFYDPWLRFDINARQKMLYGATVLRPTDALALILGGRLSDYSWSLDSAFANGNRGRNATDVDNEFIPYAGITYDLDRQHTVYASYTDVFKPQAYNFNANNEQLAPLTGKSYEIGAKGEYLDGRLIASIALFQLKQDNVAELDPSGATRPDGGAAYVAVPGVTTRGIELEASGELLTGWQLHAGYTYSRSRDRDGQRVGATQPEHLFKLATSYRLPDALNAIQIGGNVQWQSGTYFEQNIAGAPRRFSQPGHAVVGLMAAYDIDKQLRLSLQANNIFDKRYYSGIGNYNTVYYGNPSNVMATLRYRY